MKFGNTTAQMKRRIIAIILILSLLGPTVLIARLFTLQVVQAEDLQKRAARQQMRVTSISAQRGTIYDRNGEILAMSGTVWTVYLSPVDIDGEEERELVIKGLSRILDVDEDTIREKSHRNTFYEIIKKKIERPLADEVTEFLQENSIGCVGLEEDYKRYYPQGSLASTVLGFTGTDSNGLEGLEYKYESVLAGVAGRIVTARNGVGDEMPTTMEYTKVVDAKDGGSLVLTIDSTIQMYTDKYLAEAVKETGCTNRGVAIVMDVNTGGILAMSTKGDYDPNDPFTVADPDTQTILAELAGDEQAAAIGAARQLQWKNKAMSDTYEPGSVFKVFTTAMALEESLASESTSFHCANGMSVGGWFIKCHTYPRAHGTLDLPGAISASCNPYFMQLGQRVGANTYYKYFTGFGFTEKTGIDMSGEASNAGLYHSASQLEQEAASLATASFGQTFKVTPIQMITAMAAIANGGKLLTPYVVSKVLDGDGNVVSTTQPTVKRQIISRETSQRICKILGDIVNGGGSKNAYVAGYRVAGKTGTSEKRDITDRHEVVASFAGFAPADDPKVAVLVLLDEPQSPIRYGGTISAPVAQKIFDAILPYMGIEPEYTAEELTKLSRSTPSVIGQTVQAARGKIANVGLKAQVVGNGDTVVRQVPAAGQAIPANGTVLLYTEEDGDAPVTVPNFVGRSVTAVNTLASSLGLNVQLEGLVVGSDSTAVAAYQSVSDGTKVSKGTVITVTFRYSDTADG